jgi:hydrogenase maturation protein HypF
VLNQSAARSVAPDEGQLAFVGQMLRTGAGCTASSSAGRLFDAVAALLGLARINHYEGQAPAALESAAYDHGDPDVPCDFFTLDDREINLSLLVRQLLMRQAAGASKGSLSAMFHEGFAAAWAAAVERAAWSERLNTVVLSGGVFCNERLTRRLTARLHRLGLEVLRHHQVPPNDGGLSLGQAAVAAWKGRC